jgi:hypothetical protein
MVGLLRYRFSAAFQPPVLQHTELGYPTAAVHGMLNHDLLRLMLRA